jgi:hypothetical protein
MKTILTAVLGAALLVLPAGAVAKPQGTDKPNNSEKRAAIKQCKAERGKTKATRKAFKTKYHSFSRCVRQNAAEEHAENKAALRNAAKECKAERSDPDFAATHDGKSFQEFYGTGKNGKNAYGKCVSTKAREHKEAADEADEQEVKAFKNAAHQCKAEQADPGFAAAHGGKSFDEFYGTNRNKRNAFGKCVSSHSQTYVDPLPS